VSVATYTIRKRLAWRLSAIVTGVMALLAVAVFLAVAWVVQNRLATELGKKFNVVSGIMVESAKTGGMAQVRADMASGAYRRPMTRLTVTTADGRVFYRDPEEPLFVMTGPTQSRTSEVDLAPHGGERLRMTLEADTGPDRELLRVLGVTLLLVPVIGGLLVALVTAWRVREDLGPLADLAEQTQCITVNRLDQRLSLPEVATELMPWITQFNGLMDRLQAAITQLEAFNADVAHELRTPLASLMGHTEVALSRERSAAELREVMVASLEDLQQISGVVQDMLFLSRTDHGAQARRGEPVSLNALAGKVVEFHQLGLEEAALQASVEGDADVAVDPPLLQRALSNLLDNAVRHARAHSEVRVLIAREAGKTVRVMVENAGEPIAAHVLPRIFDRFYRGDVSRTDSGQHHGLGLAIVAAIARMHGGHTEATSSEGVTRVGLVLPA
jgi:two-component system, OmpR family, heavy metal sensor histidine kinase CusS